MLFVDEVHRFNKSQQDAFLPHVENGTITFIGATTENPSFEVNAALLSVRVYRFTGLPKPSHLIEISKRALITEFPNLRVADDILAALAASADGDARRALGQLEIANDWQLPGPDGRKEIDQGVLEEIGQSSLRRFDKGGDAFGDQISALHKAYEALIPMPAQLAKLRMLDGGCDLPLYREACCAHGQRRHWQRRPQGTGNRPGSLAGSGMAGQPGGRTQPSPGRDLSFLRREEQCRLHGSQRGSKRLRRPGVWMCSSTCATHPPSCCGRGARKGYRYAHDEPEGYAAGEHYFPDSMPAKTFYRPTDRGLEARIREKLGHLRQLDLNARKKDDQS